MATQGVIPVSSSYVELFPSNWCDDDSPGWTEYEYEWSKNTFTSSEKTSKFKGGGKLSLGFWSAKANASSDKVTKERDVNLDSLKISLKYGTVLINRPWLDTLLFDLGNWFLVGNTKKGAISTGKMSQVFPQSGADTWLPIIPKKMIVIKDLVIESKQFVQHYESLKTKVGGGGSVGFGPFKLGGSYSHSSRSSELEVEKSREKLKVKGCQIIGWISNLVQQSPKIDAPKANVAEPVH